MAQQQSFFLVWQCALSSGQGDAPVRFITLTKTGVSRPKQQLDMAVSTEVTPLLIATMIKEAGLQMREHGWMYRVS